MEPLPAGKESIQPCSDLLDGGSGLIHEVDRKACGVLLDSGETYTVAIALACHMRSLLERGMIGLRVLNA